ncbi:MAG: autotransporter-associated beta strand repeat-containing protein [Pirellulales bacterium]|nr:autotransporter-associated beta strand repeat-containing protein [Pirellulales bacterium]
MNRLLRILVPCLFLFLVMGSTLTQQAAAQNTYWTGGAGTLDYENPLNWGGAFPTDPKDPCLHQDVVLLKNDVTTPVCDNLNIGANDASSNPGRSYFYQSTGTLETDWTTVGALGGTASTVSNVGVLYQSGGTHKYGGQTFCLGRYQGSYGYTNLSGGAMENGRVEIGRESNEATGVFYQSGGVITDVGSGGFYFQVGRDGTGVYNLTGGQSIRGVDNDSYFRVAVNAGSWGNTNVSGTGELVVVDEIGISLYAGTVGYLTLGTGGTIATSQIVTVYDEGEPYFSFHGGTLKPLEDSTDFIDLSGAGAGGTYVGAEGGIIDTNGFNIEIQEALKKLEGSGVGSITIDTAGAGYAGAPVVKISTDGDGRGASAMAYVNSSVDPLTGAVSDGSVVSIVVTNPGEGYEGETVTVTLESGGYTTQATATATLAANGPDGGITKKGLGTLTLSATNTYTGLTDVQAGTLALTGSVAGDVAVAADAVLMGAGSIAGNLAAAGSSMVAPGMSIGTLHVEGAGLADLNGTLKIEYNGDTEEIDVLDVAGVLDIDGAIVDFDDLGEGASLDEPAYVFATYGTLAGSGAFAGVLDLPTGYVIDYAYGGNSIALVVPEPSLTALLLAGLGLLAIRRFGR